MADFYPNEQGGAASPARPINKPSQSDLDVIERTYALATQATSDVLRGIILPKGFKPQLLGLFPSATLGSSTLAIGNAGTAGKYRAAATLTATSLAPVVMAGDAALAADEEVLIAIAAASLPASGTLCVRFYGTYA